MTETRVYRVVNGYVTATMAADMVGRHRQTIWRWIGNGLLPGSRRFGRSWMISVSELRALAEYMGAEWRGPTNGRGE